jgi:hypothetical protein
MLEMIISEDPELDLRAAEILISIKSGKRTLLSRTIFMLQMEIESSARWLTIIARLSKSISVFHNPLVIPLRISFTLRQITTNSSPLPSSFFSFLNAISRPSTFSPIERDRFPLADGRAVRAFAAELQTAAFWPSAPLRPSVPPPSSRPPAAAVRSGPRRQWRYLAAAPSTQ